MGNMMSNCGGIGHIGIPTEDLDVSRAFYEELGFTLAHEKVIKNGTQRVNFMKHDNLCLELYEDTIAGCDGAIDHLSISCNDVEAAYEVAISTGKKILSEGIEALPFWEKGIRYFIIEGPMKERLEFCQIL